MTSKDVRLTKKMKIFHVEKFWTSESWFLQSPETSKKHIRKRKFYSEVYTLRFLKICPIFWLFCYFSKNFLMFGVMVDYLNIYIFFYDFFFHDFIQSLRIRCPFLKKVRARKNCQKSETHFYFLMFFTFLFVIFFSSETLLEIITFHVFLSD